MDSKVPHRFYKQEYPEVGETVVIIATKITEMGAYVKLPEYPEFDAMIQSGELSQKRVRSLNKVIRIGQVETATVSKVDPDKKTVDLSRRRLKPQDSKSAIQRYSNSKIIALIVRNLALKAIVLKHGLSNISAVTQFDEVIVLMHELYEELVWPFFERYEHAYSAFVSIVLGDMECPSTASFTSEQIRTEICARIKPEPVRVCADVQIICAGMNGLADLRRVIAAVSEVATVHLLAPPLYRFSTETMRSSDGVLLIGGAIDIVKTMLDSIPGAAYFVTKEPVAQSLSENVLAIEEDLDAATETDVSGEESD